MGVFNIRPKFEPDLKKMWLYYCTIIQGTSNLQWFLLSRLSHFEWWDFSLIFRLISSIYSLFLICFYLNDWTHPFGNTTYHFRHLELIKEKFEYFNFQAQKKLSKILHISNLSLDTYLFVSSQTLSFCFISLIILLII